MNARLLRKTMREKEITPALLAKRTGIVKWILFFKLLGCMEFTLNEIGKISEVLDLSESKINQIFFGKKVS